ncbi:MAG: hypothetical protein IT292_12430 [Deltaproteobacteria bacterium]|nr:hypothetical protein [Deltaproteobacteria bacterium]
MISQNIGKEEQQSASLINKVYREQSYMWRALALIQFPTTAIAIIIAIVMYVSADVIVDVKPRPAPGYFLVEEIPEQEFIKYSIEFVNLISSFQPSVAERQFRHALNFLQGEFYGQFNIKYLQGLPSEQSRLSEIMQLQRAQMFYINRDLVVAQIENDPEDPRQDRVIVRVPGELYTFLNGVYQQNRIDYGVYYVTLQTIPNTAFNQNGITIINLRLENSVNGVRGSSIYGELEKADKLLQVKAKRKRKPTPFTRYEWK